MASPQLAQVLEHLRAIAARPTTPGDIAAQRRRVSDYGAVAAITSTSVAAVKAFDIAGLQAEWLLPDGVDTSRRLLYLHGGAWSAGDPDSHRGLTSRIARASGMAVLAIHYRLIPEHAFPAGLDDCVHAYRWLRDNGPMGASPAQAVFIAGDSAGGNLTLATLLACKARGIPLPTAAVPLSACTDMLATGESYRTRAEADPIIKGTPEGMAIMAQMYTQGRADARDPLVSPLYGDLAGLPPLLLQVGDAEVLRDDSTMFAERARAAGVDVTLEVWPEMPHVWQLFGGFLPEADAAIERIAAFLRAH